MKTGLVYALALAVAVVVVPSTVQGDWPFSPGPIWPFQQRVPSIPLAPHGSWASSWKSMADGMADSSDEIDDPESDVEVLPEAIGGSLGGHRGTSWVNFSPSIFQPSFPTGFSDIFGGGFGRPVRPFVPWWKGPNVCVEKEEVDDDILTKRENLEKTESMIVMSKGSSGVSISSSAGGETGHAILFSVCEQTELQYVCTRKIRKNGIRKTYTEKYQCCHGFERARNKPGCVEARMVGLMETIVEMGGSDFAELVRSTGLEEKVSEMNMTVFVPSNIAVREYADEAESANQVEFYVPPATARRRRQIDSGLYEERAEEGTSSMKDIVLSHMTSGFVGVEDFHDEQVLLSDNNNSTIRINVYPASNINEKDARGRMQHSLMGGKIVTANCACLGNKEEPANEEEIEKRNIGSRRASNGVVHMVDRVLVPVQRTLAEQIASHPRLSKFRALLAAHAEKGGAAEKLLKALESHKESLTLFAPTDDAFDKLTMEQSDDLFKGKSCTSSILDHHVISGTLCSAAVPQIPEYIAYAVSRLGENLRLEWLEGEAGQWKLTLKGSNEQAEKTMVNDIDIVATNGVMHLIDSILFPVSARQMNQALQDSNLTMFSSYLEWADMMQDMENVTLFVPTDEAMKKWAAEEKLEMEDDDEELSEEEQKKVRDILMYHQVTPMINSCDMETNQVLATKLPNQTIRIMLSSSDLFGIGWNRATAQCANIVNTDKSACNGVIHVVDKVLIPPKGNLFETLASTPSFSTLTQILKDTRLEKELSDSNGVNGFTFLAPNDDALQRLEEPQLEKLLEDKAWAERVMSAHLIPGIMCCSSVRNPSPWPFTRQQLVGTIAWDVILTVHRDHKGQIHFDREPLGRGGAKVINCDLTATNGIIHTINRIIFP